MKKACIVIALVLFSVVSILSFASAGSGAEKAAISAAHVWLKIIDEGRYGESWQEASAYFQGAVSRDNWQASLEGIRKPLGRLVSRRAIASKKMKELPGAPDAVYMVIKFRTSFEGKKSTLETVTFMLEKDGKWRAAGYFIQ